MLMCASSVSTSPPQARGLLASCLLWPYTILCNWRDLISRKVLDTLRYGIEDEDWSVDSQLF